MNYSSQVRKDIKRACKARVKEHFGRCVGIQFLYTVPYVLLIILMYAAAFGKAFTLMLHGYAADDYAVSMAILNGMNSIWVIVLIMLVITGPLLYGMMKFYIGLRRGEEPRVSILFKPFTSGRSLWNGIKMEFCLFFRSLLWILAPMIIFMIAVTALAVGSVVNGAPPSVGGLIVLYLLFVLALIPISIKLMTYSAGWVVINDNEEYGVWAATRDGSHVFKGHYGKLFTFIFSFFWWYVLLFVVTYGCMLLGIFGLYAMGPVGGITVLILSFIAALCLEILIGAFLSAYVNTSFVALYEYFVTAQQQTVAGNPYGDAAQAAAPAAFMPAEPQPEEQPETAPEQSEETAETAEETPVAPGSDDSNTPAE